MRTTGIARSSTSSYWDSKHSWFPGGWVVPGLLRDLQPSTLATQHPDWILKDAAGNKLYIPWGCSGGICPQYAADIGNPALATVLHRPVQGA